MRVRRGVPTHAGGARLHDGLIGILAVVLLRVAAEALSGVRGAGQRTARGGCERLRRGSVPRRLG